MRSICHHFQVCIDVSGAYEGLASAAIVVLKDDISDLPVQRNASFTLRHGLSAGAGSSLNSTALRSEFLLARQFT